MQYTEIFALIGPLVLACVTCACIVLVVSHVLVARLDRVRPNRPGTALQRWFRLEARRRREARRQPLGRAVSGLRRYRSKTNLNAIYRERR